MTVLTGSITMVLQLLLPNIRNQTEIIASACDMHVFGKHLRQKCWNKILVLIFLSPQNMRYEEILNLGRGKSA